MNTCPITYETVVVNRKEAADKIALSGKLGREISKVISKHEAFFYEFEKVIVYYDNGQIELSVILNTVFSIHFSSVEFRKAEPQKYRLLQIADFICSIELLKIKKVENRLSKSEEIFFSNHRNLKRHSLKQLKRNIYKGCGQAQEHHSWDTVVTRKVLLSEVIMILNSWGK